LVHRSSPLLGGKKAAAWVAGPQGDRRGLRGPSSVKKQGKNTGRGPEPIREGGCAFASLRLNA